MSKIFEPAKELEITGSYDTVVVGGGFAGVAAALAAARGGNKVLLCERMFMLGGLGTAGLVTIYLPLCDGRGHQVSYGIAEELLKVSIQDGYEARYPTPWLEGGTMEEKAATRYLVRYNAAACAIAYEKLLLDTGVTLLYGTTVCDTVVEDGVITHLIVENKSGRSAIACGNVIDCSGDADVCKFAGEDTAQYGRGNILAAWYYHTNEEGNQLQMLGFADVPNPKGRPGEHEAIVTKKRYVGLNAEEISEFVINSHRSTYNHYLLEKPLSQTHMLTSIASIPQVRMTRGLKGQYWMTREDNHKVQPDSVGMFSDWHGKGDGSVYEGPYRALYGTKIKNLAAAGRTIAAEDLMWDLTRVIPVCSVTGEAAGTAAALSKNFTDVDVAALQAKLTENGVKLHSDWEIIE